MNQYQCEDCDHVVDAPRCPECGSGRVRVLSDLHLGALGIDVYVMRDGQRLIIKKPSGQVRVELTLEDLER